MSKTFYLIAAWTVSLVLLHMVDRLHFERVTNNHLVACNKAQSVAIHATRHAEKREAQAGQLVREILHTEPLPTPTPQPVQSEQGRVL